MRYDNKSVSFAADWYIHQFPNRDYFIKSGETEDYGADFAAFSDTAIRPHLVEVKTFVSDKSYYEWERKDNEGYCFKYVPESGCSINYLKENEWNRPSQEQLQEYYSIEDNTELSKNKRLYAMNAASGRRFMISNEPQYQPKWYKLYNCVFSELIIIFKDGILFYDHTDLLNAFMGYGYKYSKKYQIDQNSDSYWQMKAFISLDKGVFYPIQVPVGILQNTK